MRVPGEARTGSCIGQNNYRVKGVGLVGVNRVQAVHVHRQVLRLNNAQEIR